MPRARTASQASRSFLRRAIFLSLLAVFAPASAAAQNAPTADVPDFWIGLQGGGGLASAICAGCGESGTQSGTTGSTFLGFGLSKRVLVGMQISYWRDHGGMYSQSEDKITRGHLMIIGYYYPWKRVPVFTKFGFGLSAFTAIDRYHPSLKGTDGRELGSYVHSDGPGVMAAAGYEIFVSQRFALVPSVSYFYAQHSGLTFDTTHLLADHVTLQLVELDIGCMFHAGW